LHPLRAGYWHEQDTFEYDRFLTYTHEAIKQRLLPLTDQSVATRPANRNNAVPPIPDKVGGGVIVAEC